MSKIPVSEVYRYLDMMLRDRWGYIYGTAGILWTQSRQNSTTNEMAQKYGAKWVGHMVADCSGVMVYIWKKFGLKIPHGSNSIRRQSVGQTQLTPEPGYAAFKVKKSDYYHIGIVGADGATVYEARGTQAGFVTSKAEEWDCFAAFNDVAYSGEVEPVPTGKQVNYKAEVTTKSGSLNIRNGPGIDPNTGKLYDKIGSVPKGTIVDVWTECDNGWRYIDDDGDTGYVDGQYLTKLQDDSPAPDDPPKTVKTTVLRRWSDGVEIVLEGEWQVVYSTVGDE